MEPVDFEEYVSSHAPGVEPGPLRQLMEFPQDDLELLQLEKECTTLEPPMPEEEWVQMLQMNSSQRIKLTVALWFLLDQTEH